jgi:hypothetical protein
LAEAAENGFIEQQDSEDGAIRELPFGQNKSIGRYRSMTKAATARVLTGCGRRRNSMAAQNIQQTTTARRVGARGGTMRA